MDIMIESQTIRLAYIIMIFTQKRTPWEAQEPEVHILAQIVLPLAF